MNMYTSIYTFNIFMHKSSCLIFFSVHWPYIVVNKAKFEPHSNLVLLSCFCFLHFLHKYRQHISVQISLFSSSASLQLHLHLMTTSPHLHESPPHLTRLNNPFSLTHQMARPRLLKSRQSSHSQRSVKFKRFLSKTMPKMNRFN